MLKEKIKKIIEESRADGWVLEPDAKEIMASVGLDIPEFVVTGSVQTAQKFFKKINTPVVAKAVSKKILHKTEHQAVVTGISSQTQLKKEMERLLSLAGCERVLVEQMVPGIEVIIGAKMDYQFGPVIVLGIGGTAVEIYNDTTIRMAPLKPDDVASMVDSLIANRILKGYRGHAGVNMERLTDLMVHFSHLMMELENEVESIDLNPVMCSKDRCIIADARIILQGSDS